MRVNVSFKGMQIKVGLNLVAILAKAVSAYATFNLPAFGRRDCSSSGSSVRDALAQAAAGQPCSQQAAHGECKTAIALLGN